MMPLSLQTGMWSRMGRHWVLAVGAAALWGAAGAARADHVYWSIGVNSPGVSVGVSNAPPVVVHSRPVVVYPQPVVVYPQPVYHPRPVVVYPATVHPGWGPSPQQHWKKGHGPKPRQAQHRHGDRRHWR